MTFTERAPAGRFVGAGLIAALALALAACGGGSASSQVTGPIGTSTGVAISTATGTSQIQQGVSVVVTASVTNDVGSAGVTWTLDGAGGPAGTLTNVTTTSVTYTAPTGITGTTTPIITATSIADTTKSAAATLIVMGDPVFNPATLFPGNVGGLYGAAVVISGGLAPYTWSLNSGTLPAGITLGTTGTVSYASLSGTPSAAGTYTFQVKAVDANSKVATIDLTMVINAATACLLNGQYAVLYSGFANNSNTVSAASLNVNSTGAVTGFHDYVSATNVAAESITGTCTTRTSNNGLLTLTGAKNSPVYAYAVTEGLTEGRLQLSNGLDYDSGNGQFIKQDPAAFSQALFAGTFAFGTTGFSASGAHLGINGALTIDSAGAVTGRIDSNGATPLTAAAVTGTLGVPDANGRGTLTLQTAGAGAQTLDFSYYIVSADKLLIVSAGTTATTERVAGFVTRQVGTFDATSLASPAILSLWGTSGTLPPPSVLALGRLANADTVAGTFELKLDTADHITGFYGVDHAGATYTVDVDGRSTFSYGTGTSAHSYVGYLDGPANGYVIESGGSTGSSGLLEAQIAGPFSNTVPGLFVSGTQFATFPGPIVLLPAVRISAGSLAASYATGYFSLDTASGRGIGSLSVTSAGSGIFTMYEVDAHHLRVLRYGALARSASIEWLQN